MNLPIGVMLGGTDLDTNLAQAAGIGSEIVQIWCTKGELAPESFTLATAKKIANRCDRVGLEISALCGDTGMGFVDPDKTPKAIELTEGFFKVCRDLGVNVLSSHIGHLPEDPAGVDKVVDNLKRLGDIADRYSVTFASETGLESGPGLRDLLDRVGNPRIAVNFDPANLTMRNIDVEEAVRLMAPYIVHTHGKDGLAGGGETPIGAGDVDFPAYFGWLNKAGYTGAIAIEREGGDQWWTDCQQGIALLKKWRDNG